MTTLTKVLKSKACKKDRSSNFCEKAIKKYLKKRKRAKKHRSHKHHSVSLSRSTKTTSTASAGQVTIKAGASSQISVGAANRLSSVPKAPPLQRNFTNPYTHASNPYSSNSYQGWYAPQLPPSKQNTGTRMSYRDSSLSSSQYDSLNAQYRTLHDQIASLKPGRSGGGTGSTDSQLPSTTSYADLIEAYPQLTGDYTPAQLKKLGKETEIKAAFEAGRGIMDFEGRPLKYSGKGGFYKRPRAAAADEAWDGANGRFVAKQDNRGRYWQTNPHNYYSGPPEAAPVSPTKPGV